LLTPILPSRVFSIFVDGCKSSTSYQDTTYSSPPVDLPRNGIVTAGQVEAATAQGFNMGADLSGLLNLIAILFGGNIETQTFSIGGEDDRTYSPSGIGSKAAGRQYGLDAHSRCEGDASAMRRDYFTNGGDNHNVYPDRFKRFIKYAKQQGGQFNVAAANALYGENVRESIANNPKYYNTAYTLLVVLGEYPFIPNFVSRRVAPRCAQR
jgi:hypothetical protein